MNTRSATYLGHLPNGNPVQAHSANPLYAKHGVTLRYFESADGTRCMWEACKNGQVIAANPSHSTCELLAWSAVGGAFPEHVEAYHRYATEPGYWTSLKERIESE